MKHGNRIYCCMLKILLLFVISGILHYFYHDISKYFKFSNCHAGLFPHLYSTRKSSSNYIYSAIFIYAILKFILFLATYFPSKNTRKISSHPGSTETLLFFSFFCLMTTDQLRFLLHWKQLPAFHLKAFVLMSGCVKIFCCATSSERLSRWKHYVSSELPTLHPILIYS